MATIESYPSTPRLMTHPTNALNPSGFGRTTRPDAWWLQPAVVLFGLSAFIVYSTWAAFQGVHYHYGPYVSPFYSPELLGESPHSWFGPKPSWDLVTDVSWNYRVKKKIKPFRPRKPDEKDGTWRMAQSDVDRSMEFRKCIECFLCQDVCHVLREHRLLDEFIGPRFLVHIAALEMHPLDTENRLEDLRKEHGIGYCNITKCCTKVCPEDITITDNAIIPLKERVVDVSYDPIRRFLARYRRKASAVGLAS